MNTPEHLSDNEINALVERGELPQRELFAISAVDWKTAQPWIASMFIALQSAHVPERPAETPLARSLPIR